MNLVEIEVTKWKKKVNNFMKEENINDLILEYYHEYRSEFNEFTSLIMLENKIFGIAISGLLNNGIENTATNVEIIVALVREYISNVIMSLHPGKDIIKKDMRFSHIIEIPNKKTYTSTIPLKEGN